MHFYLIGIKGSGMSALAKILYDQGHKVLGVDIDDYFYTQNDFIDIKIESFSKMNLNKNYIYIIGNAYKAHSVSSFIINSGYKYYYYADFIKHYFKEYKFIAITGSHGKTTSTKMLSSLIDSSYLIGDGTGSGKNKENFIIEACEYKDTFLTYNPNISLVLNIDYDHPDYYKNIEQYIESFKKFIYNSELCIVNGDDKNIRKIIDNSIITYGLNDNNDVIFEYEIINKNTIVKILDEKFIIPYPGLHYAYNFVGVYLIAKLYDLHDNEIKNKILNFKLPKRRLEHKTINNIDVIFDYAHHPTEITCVYNTLKEIYQNKKIIAVFQPHTISRSIALKKEFKMALDLFDHAYLVKTFTSARENSDDVMENEIFNYWGYKVLSINEISNILSNENVYIFLGAGDIYDKI